MTLYLERDLTSSWMWARWLVVDNAAMLVGAVVEWHELGRAMFSAVHNPAGIAFEARWHSDAYDTPQDALGALADHLARSR